MFGLFRKAPAKLAREALSKVLDGEPGALAQIQKRSRKDQVAAYMQLGRLLMLDDAYAQALPVLEQAQLLAPKNDDLAGLLAECRGALGQSDAVELHLAAQLEGEPRNIGLRAALVELHFDNGDIDRARHLLETAPVPSLQLDTWRARLHAHDGDIETASTMLEQIKTAYENAMHAALDSGPYETTRQGWLSAESLHASILEASQGAEAVVISAAERGELVTNDSTNLTLLGEALLARTDSKADPTLRTPEERLAQGTPVAIAEAHLREGRIEAARAVLQPLADARQFAGFLGLGWARRLADVWRFARYLPEPPDAPAWVPLLPGYAALNREEKRIVAASVQPLASLCAPMRAAGVQVHILPLDARPSDLPSWSDLGGRTADHRAPDAIGGMARPSGAVVRLDELWQVGRKGHWTLGHEFAHLALFHMAEADFDQVAQLYARTLGVEYVGGDYQRSNVDEFFAMGYQDWLARRHGGEGHALHDDVGIVAALDAMIDRLG